MEQAAIAVSTPAPLDFPRRAKAIYFLAAWLIVGWLLLLAARYLLEYSFTVVSRDALPAMLGVAIGLSLAQLFALATLAVQLRYRPRFVAIACAMTLIGFTVVIAGAIFPPNRVAGCVIHFCVNLIAYFLTLGACLLSSKSFLRSEMPNIGRLCIRDLLLVTFVLAVFFAIMRTDGERVYHVIANDFLSLMRDYRLVAVAIAISLVQATQGVATLRCILLNQSALWTSCTLILICAATAMIAAVITLVNTTVFGAYKWETAWVIEILKTQIPWSVIFTIWFTISIYLFRSLGLLAPSQPTRTESSFAA